MGFPLEVVATGKQDIILGFILGNPLGEENPAKLPYYR
jgi:hypothetical protein